MHTITIHSSDTASAAAVAVARSTSHNEIVDVVCPSLFLVDLLAELMPDDYVEVEIGVLDAWGADWRARIVVPDVVRQDTDPDYE